MDRLGTVPRMPDCLTGSPVRFTVPVPVTVPATSTRYSLVSVKLERLSVAPDATTTGPATTLLLSVGVNDADELMRTVSFAVGMAAGDQLLPLLQSVGLPLDA